jgi:hypothetical protein
MGDRIWIVPAIMLTVFNAALALAFHPKPTSLLYSLVLLPLWMAGTVGYLCVPVLVKTIKLMLAGQEDPLQKLVAWADWSLVKVILWTMALACMNEIAFLWIKPVLNIYVPFRSDPLLANLDNAVFLGHDPWTLLTWLNTDLSGFIYHPVWYFTMIAALMVLFAQPPSLKKSAMALSYFLLWSIAGPIIHTIFPAGGPIFFERLGYGDRFAEIDGGPSTADAADYLWRGFSSGTFDIASGISAMPSLHVTMAVWTVLCVATFARKWLPLVAATSALVIMLSVSLGWHYAVDGIVGGLCAIGTYKAILRALEGRNFSSIKIRL